MDLNDDAKFSLPVLYKWNKKTLSDSTSAYNMLY